LFFEPLKNNYKELPPSENKPALEKFLTDNGIGKFVANTPKIAFGYQK
jgi:hypothetical protein